SLIREWLAEKEEALNQVQTSNFRDPSEMNANVRQLTILKEDMEKKRRTLDKLSDAGQDVMQLLQSAEAGAKIEADTEELTHRWDNLVQKLEDCSFQVMEAVTESGIPQMEEKVTEAAASPAVDQELAQPAPAKKRLVETDAEIRRNELELQLKAKESTVREVTKEGRNLMEQLERQGLCLEIEQKQQATDPAELQKWSQLSSKAREEHGLLQCILGSMKDNQVERWLDAVQELLSRDATGMGDAENLQAELNQCKEYVTEMELMERSLMQMEENVKAVQATAVPGLAQWGQDKLDHCRERWATLSKQQLLNHQEHVAENQEKQLNLKKDLAEMQEWMAQVDEEFLMRDFEYKSPEDLEVSLEEMKQEVWSCWMELLQYLDMEQGWLNTVEEKLQATENIPESTEKVTEALESLEGVLRHPGDNRTQIRELGQTLIDGGILDELISEKLEAFNSRYDQLIGLEQQLQTLKENEQAVQTLQESLNQLDHTLTSYLTDRVDAFQLPLEAQLQTIGAEIAALEVTVEEMKRRNVTNLPPPTAEGKSARGATMLDQLQRKLREISTKYQLFQKPANFEQRMLDCKRVLDGAKAELHILDVKDVEPEIIQSHLSGCMKLYKLLSEVKLEVETVIKTGRQIVQKQQTENPKAMDEQLTGLKLLYNDLGAQQVTEGKQDLEKALSLSQKFQKESAALQEWLSTNEAQLQQKNSCGDMPADIEDEIRWANAELSTLTEIGAGLQTLVEGSEAQLEGKLCGLNEAWDQVRTWTEDWLSAVLLEQLDVISLRVDNVRDQAVILMTSRGPACRDVVEPKLAELNCNFDKVSQHIKSTQHQMDEEKANVEDLLRRGEELLQQTSDEAQKELLQIHGIHERQPEAMRDASPDEVVQIGDNLTQLNAEWDRLNRMYNQRKSFDRAIEEWGRFHCDLKDMSQWLTETEELEEGLSSHQPVLTGLTRTGEQIIGQLSSPDGPLLEEKLETLVQRWRAVKRQVLDRQRLTGEDPALLDLVRRYEHLAVWLEQAENAASSLPVSATDENLKELKMDAQNERLGWLNKHAPQILASPSVSPQSRDHHVGKLRAINLKWSKALEVSMKDRKRDLEDLLAHSIELQKHQQLSPQEKSKVEQLAADWKALDGHLRESLQVPVSPWTHQPSAVHMASLASEDSRLRAPYSADAVAPTDLNKRATEMADWLLLITQMLKSNIVTVGDTKEIRTTIGRLQVTKSDLEQRHSELEDIFTLAQNIKNKTSNVDVRTSISEKEKVRSQWDSTQHGIEARLQQLEEMTVHSNQWEEKRKEVKALIAHNEGLFHNLLQRAKDPLTKQLEDSKVFQEFSQALGQDQIAAFNELSNHLLQEYSSDDTRRIKE
uniref:Utrophin n=1 Tax=Poecilia reticulata TaxID=8081 RepID=A0A3P9N7W7_POERE